MDEPQSQWGEAAQLAAGDGPTGEQAWLVDGGFTHEVTFGEVHVVKRFRSAARGEPGREWRALGLLQRYLPGLAPAPVAADLAARPPVVTMERVPGAPLGASALTEQQLREVIGTVCRVHGAVPVGELKKLEPSISHVRTEIPMLQREAQRVVPPDDDALVREAVQSAQGWLGGEDARRLLGEDGTVGFTQGDPNLRNFLWDGARVRLVDFEDSGRSDLSWDLADLVEHVTARCTPDGAWQAALDALDLEPEERWRLRASRRAKATYWLFAFLTHCRPGRRRSPADIRAQAERVLRLV